MLIYFSMKRSSPRYVVFIFCREGSGRRTALRRSADQPDGRRGTFGPVHHRGCRRTRTHAKLAEGWTNAVGC